MEEAEEKKEKKNVFINCSICFTQQPSLKSMQIHYENKHPKENWEDAKVIYEKQIEENEAVALAQRNNKK